MKNKINFGQNYFIFLFAAVLLIVGLLFYFYKQEDETKKTDVIKQSTGEIISGKFEEEKFKSVDQWKQILTPKQYNILREAGTEIPFSGELNHEKRKGTYYSVGCDKPLFRSEQKYDSGTGWPSFWAPISDDALVLRREKEVWDDRIEVLDTCGNHLGHVFDDGPKPTGKRYCMNSIALSFVPDKNQ